MNNPKPIPFALTAYGMPHVMGYLPTKSGEKHPHPLDPIAFMQIAKELGLAGVDIPLSTKVPSFDGAVVDIGSVGGDLKAALEEHGLKVVAEYGGIYLTP